MSTTEQLLNARLNGAARRLAITKAENEAAVAELQAITRSPVLLGVAAGAFMAGHRDDAGLRPFDRRAADLLLAAGGDLAAAETEAVLVTQAIKQRPRDQS